MRTKIWMRHIAALIAVASSLVLLSACDLEDDPDHVPPKGYGALFVENNTSRELRVYVDGDLVGRVGRYSDRPFDLKPGVYRIVLDQKDSARNWRDDVDIINGRLTVLDVANGPGADLDVVVYFD